MCGSRPSRSAKHKMSGMRYEVHFSFQSVWYEEKRHEDIRNRWNWFCW